MVMWVTAPLFKVTSISHKILGKYSTTNIGQSAVQPFSLSLGGDGFITDNFEYHGLHLLWSMPVGISFIVFVNQIVIL